MERYANYSDSSIYKNTKPVFQYDRGIKLRVDGLKSSTKIFQFTNQDMGGSINNTPTMEGHSYVGTIPSELMMLDSNIMCYVIDAGDSERATVLRISIPLISRQGCD